MPPEPKFFVLHEEARGPYDTGCMQVDSVEYGEMPRCPRCGKHVGLRPLVPPIKMDLEIRGQGPGDYAKPPGSSALVSERFVDAFRAEKLTGVLSFEPVEIANVVRKIETGSFDPLPPYFLMEVCLGRAAVDESRSRLRRASPVDCPECRRTDVDGIYGFKIEPGTWEGEDISRPRGLQTEFLASERLAKLMKDRAFTNVKLTPIERYWWDPRRRGPPSSDSLA
ncbi:MAG TPA: DUF1629 domain-containing protein [Myxococcales bacterium]|nr:DUF1629 domain-containing protein [Myxococcales bacterium]